MFYVSILEPSTVLFKLKIVVEFVLMWTDSVAGVVELEDNNELILRASEPEMIEKKKANRATIFFI